LGLPTKIGREYPKKGARKLGKEGGRSGGAPPYLFLQKCGLVLGGVFPGGDSKPGKRLPSGKRGKGGITNRRTFKKEKKKRQKNTPQNRAERPLSTTPRIK